MSTLRVDGLQPRTGSTITVPTGYKLYAPGHVIQAQTYNFTTTFTTTNTSYETVYGVNITPTSASSLIFITSSILRCTDSWTGGVHWTALFRGTATNLIEQRPNNYAGSQGDTYNNPFNVSLQYLDSPATTATITYNVRVASSGGYPSMVNRRYDGTQLASASNITVMEIAQ